ncbi:MAG: tRNA lysidine(34) synthetase TilS [Moritella sp.]|uniref:tRNA lysidine(34) synthetase TilS n=1 Tax=Moritella sp. TaxID=78556 RepID=UPI0029B6B362|nr:tRNA lysidine(34) synthetase TilS [Moritella sp.]MDX2322543.1 tRNA lysidine(34) synthetase TilS [Moritella sp.]
MITVVTNVNLFSTFQHALQSLTIKPMQLVLAYSGGLDSHVLLHLMARYKLLYPQHNYLAVHVHHGLSDNADDWLAHCQQTAKALGIHFVAEKVVLNVSNRESLEAKARTARYQAIAKHLTAESLLLLGQHLDDQLETFLLQLKRGAGVKGLSAMAAKMPFTLQSNSQIVRPLLTLPQQALLDYATQAQLTWVEDESNNDQSYDRNYLRHEIIPSLKQRWPNIANAVHRSAELCAEQQELADEIAQMDLTLCEHNLAGLKIVALQQLSKIRRNNVIRFWLAKQQLPMPSRHHLDKLWLEVVNAADDANPQLSWQAGEFRRYQGVLYNQQKYAELKDVVITLEHAQKQTIRLPDNIGLLQLQGNNCADNVPLFIDNTSLPCVKAPLAHEVVTIRFRGEGKCHPIGRSGSRSIKKLYQEYQIAPWLRDRIPLVYYGDELVCAVGLWVCKGREAQAGIYWHITRE